MRGCTGNLPTFRQRDTVIIHLLGDLAHAFSHAGHLKNFQFVIA